MNSVSLIGNLASDVDLREVSDDKRVANFLLAVGRGGRDAGADFVGVSVWGPAGESSAPSISARDNASASPATCAAATGKKVASGAASSRSWGCASTSSADHAVTRMRR
jgi:Single-strand binding protein family.